MSKPRVFAEGWRRRRCCEAVLDVQASLSSVAEGGPVLAIEVERKRAEERYDTDRRSRLVRN